MASLFRDPKTPFWQLRWKDTIGKWRSRSLRPLRHCLPTDTRKARAKRDAQSLEEHLRSPQRDLWSAWTLDYLRFRYANSPATYTRNKAIWHNLRTFMEERNILSPQEVTYRDCMDYMTFRTRKAAHNTAKLELTLLGAICEEAVRRGMISRNPATRLRIKSVPSKVKPELTDEHITAIRAALKSEPDWMSHAFEIALHQGCRLSETALFLSDVDIDNNRLHFRKTKGDKPFTVPLNPVLKPILQALLGNRQRQSEDHLFVIPANAARDFHSFFKKLGIPGLTFHCSRVSMASRLARAGYPIMKALRLLNHGSTLIHKVYVRLEPADCADAFAHLQFPATDKQLNENQDAPPATPAHEAE